jgi:two-component system, LuxR family, response regulator FixJ
MPETRIVYVIDDEEPVRDSVAFLLEARELSVQSFPSPIEFLAVAPSLVPGCVLTDMQMPGMDGLGLLRHMRDRDLTWPVVVMTAHGEVSLAVQALKAGAVDFIEKPFPGPALIDAVLSALQAIDETREQAAGVAEIKTRMGLLTPREREVLDQLVAGNQNKVIAYNLGMSPRTVEVHRARVMEKMQARSLSALVRMALTVGTQPVGKPK